MTTMAVAKDKDSELDGMEPFGNKENGKLQSLSRFSDVKERQNERTESDRNKKEKERDIEALVVENTKVFANLSSGKVQKEERQVGRKEGDKVEKEKNFGEKERNKYPYCPGVSCSRLQKPSVLYSRLKKPPVKFFKKLGKKEYGYIGESILVVTGNKQRKDDRMSAQQTRVNAHGVQQGSR